MRTYSCPDGAFLRLEALLSLLSVCPQADREGACDCMLQIIAPNSEQLLHPFREGTVAVVDRGGGPHLSPFFTLQFGGLFDGTVLVEQFQHFLLVVEHFHHGVSGLCHLVHHQLTALHVTLRTDKHITAVESKLVGSDLGRAFAF